DSKAYTGHSSLHIVDNDTKSYGIDSDFVKITGGKEHTASMMTYRVNERKFHPAIYLRYYDKNKKFIDRYPVAGGNYKEWTKVSVSGKAPEKASYVQVRIRSDGPSQRNFYVDDVVLQDEDGKKYPLKNSGFENQL